MDIRKEIDLLDCPICQGPALLEEEGGWCCYVTCLDCGCRTAEIEYTGEEDRLNAARQAARLWHMGKVISSSPGE